MKDRSYTGQNHHHPALVEIKTPFAHVKVRLEDLQDNGSLLSPKEIEKVMTFVANKKAVAHAVPVKKKDRLKKEAPFAERFKKRDLGTQYSVIVFEDDYYAIYRGVKQKCDLGSGGFGYVKLVQNIKTLQWAVIKLSASFQQDDHEYMLLEEMGMAIGQLDRVAGYGSEFVIAQRRVHPSFWMSSQRNMVMKLASGRQLTKMSADNIVLSDVKLLQIVIQVLKAYERLANKKIIHGDLNPNNIFYDLAKDQATMIDYGASSRKPLLRSGARRSLVITQGFSAPELSYVNGKKKYRYSKETDMYALGKTIQFLLKSDKEDTSCHRLKEAGLRSRVHHFCYTRMCHEDADKRASISDAIHFFMECLSSQLTLLPRPFRKIACISLDEYRALRREVIEASDVMISHSSHQVVEKSDEVPGFRKRLAGWTKGLSLLLGVQDEEQLAAAALLAERQAAEARMTNATVKLSHYHGLLKQFDEVWWVDASQQQTKHYIELRHELENAGIFVGDRCFISSMPAQSDRLNAVMAKLAHEHQALNKLYFVSFSIKDIQLDQAYIKMLCLIDCHEATELSTLNAQIEDFCSSDIQEEYRYMAGVLKDLCEQYRKDVNKESVFLRAMLEVSEDIDQRYTNHQLTYPYLQERLSRLRKTLGELEVKMSPVSTGKHYQALFSLKSHDNHQASDVVSQLEGQVKAWVNTYH